MHSRKLRPQQSAKIKQMQMIFAVKRQANKVTKGLRTFFKCFHEKKKINKFLLIMKGHAVTLQILFLRGISWWWKVEKTFSSLIFWKHGAVNEFYGEKPNKGAEFPVIRGLEKPKLLHTRTCTWQYNNRQSNYRLMNVLFCTRALFPDFSKSSKQ